MNDYEIKKKEKFPVNRIKKKKKKKSKLSLAATTTHAVTLSIAKQRKTLATEEKEGLAAHGD